MNNTDERNNLQEIITQALQEMKDENGGHLDLGRINLAELERRTGISRKRLRKIRIRKIARTYEEKKKSATIVGCTFLFIQIFDFVLAGILPE